MVEGGILLPHSASVMSSTRRTDTPARLHLDERLFYAALPAVVPLNDGGLKRDTLELGDLEGDVPGSGGKIAAVMAAAVTLALLVTLIPGSLGQFFRLGLQLFVEGFLYAASYQLLELPLDNFLV